MLRSFHKLPGLVASVLIIVLALSGVVLSTIPALESATAHGAPAAGMTTAELAARVARHLPGVTHIARHASGQIIADYITADSSGADVIDPTTGAALAPYAPSAFVQWMINLHRSLFLGTPGRWTAALGALAMVALCISGILLLVRRMGGWWRLFARARGTTAQRLHVEIGRLAVLGLLLSATTGLWMAMANLQVISNGLDAQPEMPASVDGGAPLAIGRLSALATVPVASLRELTFPVDANDVFTLVTDAGQGFVDQATGKLLGWLPHGRMRLIYETIYMLHTGEGFWSLGLLLGIAALGAPVMAASGALVWWRRSRALPRFRHNH